MLQTSNEHIITVIQKHSSLFHPVISFNAEKEKLLLINFTQSNKDLSKKLLTNTTLLSEYIQHTLKSAHCKYGIGGYAENRILYTQSEIFNKSNEEPRSLHLGIDIWGSAGTPVFAPLGGTVHSFAFNDAPGDYGATIILMHQLSTITFHTLYGHLSLKDIQYLKEGKYISQGEAIGHFGELGENGNWPPHLHFQIIIDLHEMKGDYPGVCKLSEKEKYLKNSPDADIILNMMQYAQAD